LPPIAASQPWMYQLTHPHRGQAPSHIGPVCTDTLMQTFRSESAMPRPNRHTLFPFLSWLPRQTRASVGRDAIVGLSGAVLALPQSIAYALIAGLPP